ncbi:hypothetical protein ABT263_24910 [Kitasatospora sp. NPDC001603]|uniref:hypothetical protein n=1 Tax=Kitasatospora sp. NPDC001603 TaxID=3154388 RepID=UPI0033271C7C
MPLLPGEHGPYHLMRRIGAGGTTTAVRVSYGSGTDLWSFPPRTAAPTAARAVLGAEAVEGPVVFVRVDGHHHAAPQHAAGRARARIISLKDAVLALVTRQGPTGSVARVWLDTVPQGAVPAASDSCLHAADEDALVGAACEAPGRSGGMPRPGMGVAR